MTFTWLRRLIRRVPGAVIKAVPLPEPGLTEGPGTRAEAGRLCRENGWTRVLLVTDRNLYALGHHEKVLRALEESGVAVSVFYDIASEPNIAIVDAGRKAVRDCAAQGLIALGGGAVLDSCKMIAAGARMGNRRTASLLLKFLPVPGKTLPILAIPTTAGTGAEITVGTVVTNRRGAKGATVLIGLDVRHVILDSELTVNAPRKVTAACGIDALSHGLEGVVAAVRGREEDLEKSMECVRLVLENLPPLLAEPQDTERRQAMCRAALYGGNAINKQLAGYVHAFAHSIGARYHLPHGHAIALALLPVMEFQQDRCAARLAALSRYCGLAGAGERDAVAKERLLEALRQLIAACGFPPMGAFIPREDYGRLETAIAWDSINYSAPTVFSRRDIDRVLDRINETGG